MKMEHENHQNSPKVFTTSKHYQKKKFKTQNKYDHDNDSEFTGKDNSQ